MYFTVLWILTCEVVNTSKLGTGSCRVFKDQVKLFTHWTRPQEYGAFIERASAPVAMADQNWKKEITKRFYILMRASLLFPDIIPFCMFSRCSFAAFIFFLTSPFTFLYSSPASVFVYFSCFSCRLWSRRSRTSFLTQSWIFFFCINGPLQLLRIALLLNCPQECTSLSRTQRAANFPPILTWNTSAISGSLSFSRSNRMQRFCVKHWIFSFDFTVVNKR